MKPCIAKTHFLAAATAAAMMAGACSESHSPSNSEVGVRLQPHLNHGYTCNHGYVKVHGGTPGAKGVRTERVASFVPTTGRWGTKPHSIARREFFRHNAGHCPRRCFSAGSRRVPPTSTRSSSSGSEIEGPYPDDHDHDHDAAGFKGAGGRGVASGAGVGPMPRMVSWGLNSRSQPSARKALGSSSKTHTIVHVCEVCGSEHVQWVGRCPTCKEWNSVKPFKVRREHQGSSPSRIAKHGISRGLGSVGAGSSGDDLEFQGLRGGTFGAGSGGVGWLPMEGFSTPTRLSDVVEAEGQDRLPLPGTELPRVLGGGLVRGSLAMLGGDPGVGKSTLLLQLAGQLASPRAGVAEREAADVDFDSQGVDPASTDTASPVLKTQQPRVGTVVYVSGEENNSQVAARAARMGINAVDLYLYCETDVDVIIDQMVAMEPRPALVMVDSIQTMRTADSASSPGSVTQVKECASRLVRLAKRSGMTVIIVGHVTKSGAIAGPKVVEHMVDTVLYLQGDRFSSYRLLRSVKNRFGPSNEIGVFQMLSTGLEDVADPSMLFLSPKHASQDSENSDGGTAERDMDGSAVCVYMEGSRPILCELQSLVTYSRLPSPRRTSDGLPIQRLLLLLAVLQKRLGYDMSSREVYLNIVGGLKVQETASDLAVALAIVSSYATVPVRSDTCFVGEIGLGGELRPVQQLARRIQEAETFGFSRVVVPFTPRRRSSAGAAAGLRKDKESGAKREEASESMASAGSGRGRIEVVECRTLKDAVVAGLTSSAMPKRRRRRSSSTSSRRSSIGGEGTDGGEPEFGWQRKKSRGEESRIELEAASGGGLFSSGVVDDQEVDTSSLEEGGWGSRAGMGEGDGVEDHEGFRDYEDLQEEEGERGWD